MAILSGTRRIEAQALEIYEADVIYLRRKTLVYVLMIRKDNRPYTASNHLPHQVKETRRFAHTWETSHQQMRVALN